MIPIFTAHPRATLRDDPNFRAFGRNLRGNFHGAIPWGQPYGANRPHPPNARPLQDPQIPKMPRIPSIPSIPRGGSPVFKHAFTYRFQIWAAEGKTWCLTLACAFLGVDYVCLCISWGELLFRINVFRQFRRSWTTPQFTVMAHFQVAVNILDMIDDIGIIAKCRHDVTFGRTL